MISDAFQTCVISCSFVILGEFDMRVKDCEASDGQTGKHLPLSDPEGCIIRPKLIGKFSKVSVCLNLCGSKVRWLVN
jgi:hypothetical protein